MEWWLWILGGLLLLGLELALPGGFFLVFFGFAALIVGGAITFFTQIPAWVEWITFSGLSVAFLCLFRGRLLRLMGSASEDQVDRLEGQQAIIIDQPIAVGSRGQVTLRGAPWQAENVGESDLPVGGACRVVAVDGLVLKIKS